jgi:hypothetical protein
MQIVEAIRVLGSGARGDPLLDVEVLARAVEVGLLDAPHLRSNPLACGRVRTQAVDGAIVPLDEEGKPISEARRVARALASA